MSEIVVCSGSELCGDSECVHSKPHKKHITAWSDGEKCDKETGFSHLWHAGCCLVFAIWLELKGELTNEIN